MSLFSPPPSNMFFEMVMLILHSNLTSWYKDEANHSTVENITNKARGAMRKGVEEQDYISYTNIGREDLIIYRYKGVDRLEKLKALKKEWDPAGVFTTEFL